MYERNLTLATLACGIAGAIVMSCTPAPGEAAELHGCHQLKPAFTELHSDLWRGVHVGILRYTTLTNDHLDDTGRAVVLAVLDAVGKHPGMKMLPASKFVPASIEFCIAAADRLTPVRLVRSPQQHGDI